MVELLIVAALVSILISMAAPRLQAWIRHANMASMISDAKNAIIMQEHYRAENNTFMAVPDIAGPAFFSIGLDSIRVSRGNTLKVEPGSSGIADSYLVTVSNGNAAPGKSPLTWHSTGVCTWADGSSC